MAKKWASVEGFQLPVQVACIEGRYRLLDGTALLPGQYELIDNSAVPFVVSLIEGDLPETVAVQAVADLGGESCVLDQIGYYYELCSGAEIPDWDQILAEARLAESSESWEQANREGLEAARMAEYGLPR